MFLYAILINENFTNYSKLIYLNSDAFFFLFVQVFYNCFYKIMCIVRNIPSSALNAIKINQENLICDMVWNKLYIHLLDNVHIQFLVKIELFSVNTFCRLDTCFVWWYQYAFLGIWIGFVCDVHVQFLWK